MPETEGIAHETIGHCKHGTFSLLEGCKQCIAESRAEQSTGNGPSSPTSTTGDIPAPAPETALVLRPGEDIEARGYFEEAMKILEYAEGRVIATADDLKVANDDMAEISKLKKVMENKRKSLLDPLKLQSEAIRSTYDYLMLPVLEADKITRAKMLAYDAEQKRKRAEQEEINRLRLEAAQKEMELKGELTESVDLVEVAPEPAKSISTAMGSSGTVDHWKYEVIDPSLIPREYLVIDNAQLTAIARRHHDKKPIAGIRFYNEPYIASRAR